MRPHGRAQISARAPRALGVCQRCNFLYNLDDLQWQWDWLQGPRLFNLRIKVCQSCLDTPQENGRTIVLPADPIPIELALPEPYAVYDNPLSYLGYNPADSFTPNPPQFLNVNIGNMTLNAGVDAAFNSATNKRAYQSAGLSISNSSFNNWVGKSWNSDTTGMSLIEPSTSKAVTHVVSSFTLYAPNDAPFLNAGPTGVHLDGSNDGHNWTTIYSGTTAGTVGEVLTANTTSGAFYPYHRINLQGDGFSAVALAQAVLNVSDHAANDI